MKYSRSQRQGRLTFDHAINEIEISGVNPNTSEELVRSDAEGLIADSTLNEDNTRRSYNMNTSVDISRIMNRISEAREIKVN